MSGPRDGLKMDGAGNTFVVVDERADGIANPSALARAVCSSSSPFGGADGLLLVGESDGDVLARMRIFNADGSEAEMCGNGVRCVARYLVDRGAGDRFAIATRAGVVAVEILVREPFEARIHVGEVRFDARAARDETVDVDGRPYAFVDVSVGNPHAVVFVDDVAATDLGALATAFARHPRFPSGVNVHVARLVSSKGEVLEVRHYERGVGPTLACGTGAVACAAVAIARHGAASPLAVRVPGGMLRVEWRPDGSAWLAGPAEPLFAHALSA